MVRLRHTGIQNYPRYERSESLFFLPTFRSRQLENFEAPAFLETTAREPPPRNPENHNATKMAACPVLPNHAEVSHMVHFIQTDGNWL